MDLEIRFGYGRKWEGSESASVASSHNYPSLLCYVGRGGTGSVTARPKPSAESSIEIYDAGMINNVLVLQSLDALTEPLHFQFVLGVLGGMQPTEENLVFLKSLIPQSATWSLCAVGLNIYSLGPAALAAGGNVRVGFEDCVHISKGVLAESNAQIVAKLKRFSEEMGREVASPSEARRILSLPKK
jgi:3-keto-5-aminohexanoate cleavage enzyme